VNKRGKIETQKNGPIPDELVDAFFDRELDEGSREKFFTMLRGDLDQCAKVARTQRMISSLREPIEAPDLTASIMGSIARRRAFLPPRLRRIVTASRFAVAAGLLLGILTIAVIHRMAPETVTLTELPRPVSRVVSSSAQEATAGVQQLQGAMDAMKARISEPAAELSRLLSTDLPEIDCAQSLPDTRVYLIGTPASTPLPEHGSFALHTGAGSQFVVPPVVYLDGASTRIAMPPTSDRGHLDWVGAWRENLFILQQVDTSSGPEQ
jgi:hypothetical protein